MIRGCSAIAVLVGALHFVAMPTLADGKKLYADNCTVCHMEDGGGVPMMQPELIKSPMAAGKKGPIIDMILWGSDAKVASGDFMNQMPSLKHLKDKEIAEIASYVRTHFENKGGAVTADDVRQRRKLKSVR